MKALIVDDEPLARRELRRLLDAHADLIVVGEAGNIDEARSLIERHEPDVVFLDILMPEKEGLETLLEIKQRFPSVAVFVMSGGGTRGKHDFLAVAKKFGATGVVKKPATPKDLIALIDALPEKHSSETTQRIA